MVLPTGRADAIDPWLPEGEPPPRSWRPFAQQAISTMGIDVVT